jgi:hypothetical protein
LTSGSYFEARAFFEEAPRGVIALGDFATALATGVEVEPNAAPLRARKMVPSSDWMLPIGLEVGLLSLMTAR